MTTISTDFQKSIETKIETAFNNGNGHYFMQKNNFEEIIAVSEYDIEENENKGFEYFSLNYLNRPAKVEVKKEVIIEIKKECKNIESCDATMNFLYDFPEFYNHCGL